MLLEKDEEMEFIQESNIYRKGNSWFYPLSPDAGTIPFFIFHHASKHLEVPIRCVQI